MVPIKAMPLVKNLISSVKQNGVKMVKKEGEKRKGTKPYVQST